MNAIEYNGEGDFRKKYPVIRAGKYNLTGVFLAGFMTQV